MYYQDMNNLCRCHKVDGVGVQDRTVIFFDEGRPKFRVEYGSNYEAMQVLENIVTVQNVIDQFPETMDQFVFPLPGGHQMRMLMCTTVPLDLREGERVPAPETPDDDLDLELYELH